MEEGRTWEQISQETGLSIDEIQQTNPELDPQMDLVPGSQIIIPNPADPITNLNIIPALDPQSLIPAETETLPVADSESKNPPKWNFINEIKFL